MPEVELEARETRPKKIRLAVLVTHPIQHFAPWHRELARVPDVDLKVFFCCDWGVNSYVDPGFKTEVAWDIPLLEGYAHEFLPIDRRPQRLGFWEVDNRSVGAALDQFEPDVVTVFGYAHRTNWRVASWARRNRRPLLLYSDSNARRVPAWWKRVLKNLVVGGFYQRYVDAALFVGDNNRAYHARYGVPGDRLFAGVYPIERRRLLREVPDRAASRADLRSALGIPDDAFLVLFCGKYIARKRPMDVVLAVNSLARKRLPVWALLVGEGEQRATLESFCKTENVQSVRLTGFVNQSMLPRYYAAADTIAVTSELDPHPLVVSEAACFGLPVIVSDRVGCIGPQDTAQPGQNAIVFPCGNTEHLEQAIGLLHRDRNLYAKMSAHSILVSESQDELAASEQMAAAARRLCALGRRGTRRLAACAS